MCLAFPMRIERVTGETADVSVGDIKSTASVALIENPKKGDYVLVHVGVAIEKIDRVKAREILGLIQELGQKMDAEKSHQVIRSPGVPQKKPIEAEVDGNEKRV